MSRYLISLLLVLSLLSPVNATTIQSYSKTAGSAEIDSFHPTTSRCSRIRDVTGKTTAMQFNSTDGTCTFFIFGVVPPDAPSYEVTIRLYYYTTDTATKTVSLDVQPYAIVDHAASGADAERQIGTTDTNFTSGVTAHLSRQVTYIIVNDIPIVKQDDSACDSACNGVELAIRIKEAASNDIDANALYLWGYEVIWEF